MEQYQISCEDIDYDNTSTRRVFWELFDHAKRQTGFDAASAKIYIQVYPDKSGGCLMYITKLENEKIEKTTQAVGLRERTFTQATGGDVYEKCFRPRTQIVKEKKYYRLTILKFGRITEYGSEHRSSL